MSFLRGCNRFYSSTGTRFVFVSIVRLGRNLRSNENENESSTGTHFVFVFVARLGLAQNSYIFGTLMNAYTINSIKPVMSNSRSFMM